MPRKFILPALLLTACATAPGTSPKPAPSGPVASTAPAASSSASTAAATATKATAAADLTDHLGDSAETAVPVPKDAPNDGIDFMNNWTYDRFGRFRIKERAIAHAGEGAAERRYRVTKVELPDGSLHTVYFDITENWNAWVPPSATPPAKPPAPPSH